MPGNCRAAASPVSGRLRNRLRTTTSEPDAIANAMAARHHAVQRTTIDRSASGIDAAATIAAGSKAATGTTLIGTPFVTWVM